MVTRAWDEGIATGIESVDTEHRLQVSLVNALEELLRRQDDLPLAEKTLAQLVDFTSVHFLSEELMMRLYAYPQHDAHCAEHARLVDQAREIGKGLSAGGAASALASTARLREWLTSHIRSQDQAFALWCARNKIVPG